MRRLIKFLKYFSVGIIVITLLIVLFVVSFFVKNKAPFIEGNVEYGISYRDELKVDIYQPTKAVYDASPVVFFIHGGAWIRGTKASINFNRFNGAVNILREKGYTIICPDYTPAGNGKSVFPQCILDIYDAIEWTKQHASTYKLDTTNMGLLGESAGAHIAMMIAFSETPLSPDTYHKSHFNYLVDVYGPNDLTDIYHGYAVETLDASLRKVSHLFGSEFNIKEYVFGFDPAKDSVRATELLNSYSPIKIVHQNKTPVLIIHGKNDRIVPLRQSLILKTKLDSLAIPNDMHLLDGVDHNFLYATTGQKDSTQTWISDFVLRHYRQQNH